MSTLSITPTAHVIYDHGGDIESITSSDDTAWMATSEGFTAETNLPVTDIVEMVAQDDWTEFAGEGWRIIASGVDGYLDQYPGVIQNPMFPRSGSNITRDEANERLQAIYSHGTVADLPEKRALTEIITATMENREPNAAFFESSFMMSLDDDDLQDDEDATPTPG